MYQDGPRLLLCSLLKLSKSDCKLKQLLILTTMGWSIALRRLLRKRACLPSIKVWIWSFAGTVTPLIGIGFQASAMFFTYEFSKRFFSRFKENPSDRLPLQFVAMSGLIASLPTALVAVHIRLFFRPLFSMQEFVSKYKNKELQPCMLALSMLGDK